MVELDNTAQIKLARELVMNIRNYKLVFADYGIDETDYYELEKSPFFKKIKEQFTIEWNSCTSTKERLQLESMAYIERLAPALTRRALDPEESLQHATGWVNTLMKTAGFGETKEGSGTAADRFVIQINLGADVETYNKSIEINPNDIDLGKHHEQTVDARPLETSLELIRPPRQG